MTAEKEDNPSAHCALHAGARQGSAMISSRCFRSISKLSSSARLVRHASRQVSCGQGLIGQDIFLGRSTSVSQFLSTQSQFGRRFTRSLYSATVVCDLSRMPEILVNSLTQGVGVDTDISDDDDEMSSPVQQKHRNKPGY